MPTRGRILPGAAGEGGFTMEDGQHESNNEAQKALAGENSPPAQILEKSKSSRQDSHKPQGKTLKLVPTVVVYPTWTLHGDSDRDKS